MRTDRRPPRRQASKVARAGAEKPQEMSSSTTTDGAAAGSELQDIWTAFKASFERELQEKRPGMMQLSWIAGRTSSRTSASNGAVGAHARVPHEGRHGYAATHQGAHRGGPQVDTSETNCCARRGSNSLLAMLADAAARSKTDQGYRNYPAQTYHTCLHPSTQAKHSTAAFILLIWPWQADEHSRDHIGILGDLG